MKELFRFCFIVLLIPACTMQKQAGKKSKVNEFSFLFMTDIHIQPELGAVIGVQKAIDTANKIKADFVLTGGDLVYDVLRGPTRADSLFQLYKRTISKLNKPVYHVIGNHELFGIYPESKIDSSHPDYKYGMFERYLGKTFYSFDHKGWHFIALNSIEERNKKYIGHISQEQINWLKEDLKKVNSVTPVAMVMHIPLISVQQQIYPKEEAVMDVPNELWVDNRNEVLDLFKDHKLKLVLQGHLHWVEDINVGGKTRFITGGAIAGRPSWKGTRTGEEGFMVIKVKAEEIDWEYIDYGWEAASAEK